MWFSTRYPLEPHGRKRLEVRRNMDWSEVIVLLDGVELGRVDGEGLIKGYEQKLWDQTLLRIWLERGPRNTPFLYLTRNGHPLPGSEGDPVKIIRLTLSIIWILAGVQILFALMVIRNGRADATIYWALGLGCILVILGLMAHRRSLPGMIGACVVCFGEVAVFFASVMRRNAGSIFSLLFALSIFGWLLQRGIKAVRDINAVRLPIRHPPEPFHHDAA